MNGKKILDIHSYITRHAPLFGLEVLSAKFPKSIPKLNIDVMYNRLIHLVVSRKNAYAHGQAAEFVNVSNQLGVALDADIQFAGPAALSVGTILTTSAVANWDDFVMSGEVVAYDIQVIRNSNNQVMLDQKSLAVSNKTITGLTTGIAYSVRVRAVWHGRKFFTAWTSYLPFTTS